jgi:selenocysteine-specific elongation factor
LKGASPLRAAAIFVATSGAAGIEGAELAARVTTTQEELLPSLGKEKDVVSLPAGGFLSREAFDALASSVVDILERFHKENPLKGSMALEELRAKLFAHTLPGAFERVLDALAARLRRSPAGLALQSHSVRLSPGEERARATLVASALRGGLQGVDFGPLSGDRPMLERISKLLLTEGTLCRVGDLLLHRTVVEEFKEKVRKRWTAGSRLDVSELKEMTGLSRKFVIPLLEYLDRERLTRRVGADRFVLP